ncbi:MULTISPECIES: MgtC/SapB family protein [Cupriavidus]|uniref:Protein MgtC n=1 Tax=Cupriavidus pauculus TaxID=82633 RepID=A0A5P2H9X7_9BURK|nr:MgtC/SapB family protein [Cupriavidus pauculus]QET04882.1 MgtC/SapB family protein [Cupriavidus pauculus]
MSLEAFQNVNPQSLLDTAISLASAFVLGAVIGYERQYRQRTAGLRTNVLVALGAAIFVDLANHIAGHDGAVRVIAYVVSGIGFLGAGVIMREEGNVRGLNTAATLWCSAAVGACAGADLILEAAVGCAFILAANTLLRPMADRINRQPLDTPAVEVAHSIHVIASRARQKEVMRLLEDALEAIGHPASDLEVEAFGEQDVQIEARLAATSVDGDTLDRIVAELAASSAVTQAFWNASTTE